MSRHFVLTAAEMRAAEAVSTGAGISVETLMERAGAAVADAAWRFAGPVATLILCGPGNNGGDGYVVARLLRERGVAVRVAALAAPATDAALAARQAWDGEIETLAAARRAPLLIDALFGTGLTRPLDPPVSDILLRLAAQARIVVAIDLPSGVATDDGRLLSPVPVCDLTLALGALKPSHLLHPAARHMGRLVIADIGVDTQSGLTRLARPALRTPGPDDHKYSRGYVAVVGGDMPGASALTAAAALRAGAGYVRLLGNVPGLPLAIVQGGDLDDDRIGAVAIGPGLGRGDTAEKLLDQAMGLPHPLVLDADALTLLGGSDLAGVRALAHVAILTPHAGEFGRLFGDYGGSKVEAVRTAAAQAGAVIVFKGSDCVIAAPDGRAAIASAAPAWLASAGTGDVLTGIIAAMRAQGLDPFAAACAGVWLHGEAARLAGSALIADDLLDTLSAALAKCL